MSDCEIEFAGNLTQTYSHTQSSDLTTLITKRQKITFFNSADED